MRRIVIDKTNDMQRLDKFLLRYMDAASMGFIYKMLRKKNIKLNGKKAEGKEILKPDDVVEIFICEDSIRNFIKQDEALAVPEKLEGKQAVKLDIVYEDDDLLFINKPDDMLSQKAKPDDLSANEYIVAYLRDKGITDKSVSVCNRLDRNTTGLLAAGKNLHAVQSLSKAFKDRSIHKYYVTLVKGRFDKDVLIEGSLVKDEKRNRVTISDKEGNIKTRVSPLIADDKCSLVKVELITGKTHQIRAHLAYIGHPIIGDYKYGDFAVNDYFKKKYGLSHQLLHAYEMIYGKLHIYAMPPEIFRKILSQEGYDYTWQHGTQEV